MNYIRIESIGDKTKLEINGKAQDLVNMLASSIVNDPEFGVLLLTALAVVSTMNDNELTNNINLN